MGKNISEIVSEYNDQIKQVFDHHAPMKSKLITVRHEVPWFDSDALKLKTQARQAERCWVKHKSVDTLQQKRTLRNIYKKHLNDAREKFINQAIDSCGNDTRKLFNTVSGLAGKRKANPLPESVGYEQLANDFANFF